jgi:hypothetical protein
VLQLGLGDIKVILGARLEEILGSIGGLHGSVLGVELSNRDEDVSDDIPGNNDDRVSFSLPKQPRDSFLRPRGEELVYTDPSQTALFPIDRMGCAVVVHELVGAECPELPFFLRASVPATATVSRRRNGGRRRHHQAPRTSRRAPSTRRRTRRRWDKAPERPHG